MTQIDSNRPVFFNVAINGSSFSSNSAPNDGFIDPTTVQRYEQVIVQTGTSSPSATNGDTVTVNDVSITFTTAGGLSGSGIVATINAQSDEHHVVASLSSGNLQLTNSATYENYGILLTGTPAVLAELGWTAPVTTMPNSAGVDTLADSQAKSRANSRWNTLNKMIGFEATPIYVGGVVVTGGGIDSAPTAISFTVAYSDVSNLYTYDELNDNALMKGIPALTRMVARAMTTTRTENTAVINPGTDANWHFTIGDQVEALVVGAIATDLSTAAAAITVTTIPTTR
jgi:hypothetical protein